MITYLYDLNASQEVPVLTPHFPGSPYDWGYTVKPKENIAGSSNDRTIPYPRGFGLGGCR